MLTTRGKQVKEIVLNNLALYAHQKIQHLKIIGSFKTDAQILNSYECYP